MAQPALQSLHFPRPLDDVSLAYSQSRDVYKAQYFAPVIPTDHQSNLVYVYKKSKAFRSDAQERAPHTESVGTGWELDTPITFQTKKYSVHQDIGDDEVSDADPIFNLMADATDLVTDDLLLGKELNVVSKAMKTGVWAGVTGTAGTDLTGVSSSPSTHQFLQWDQAGSDPIGDVKAAIRGFQKQSGKKPNRMIIAPQVADALVENPEIVDRVKYTQLGFLSTDLLAQAFGLPAGSMILVAEAVENTANEGATDVMTFVYPKASLLFYAEPNPGRKKPSAMYTFAWTAYGDSNSARMKTIAMPWTEDTRVEGTMSYDVHVMAPILGTYFDQAVS